VPLARLALTYSTPPRDVRVSTTLTDSPRHLALLAAHAKQHGWRRARGASGRAHGARTLRQLQPVAVRQARGEEKETRHGEIVEGLLRTFPRNHLLGAKVHVGGWD
jgi:hypothetical protein